MKSIMQTLAPCLGAALLGSGVTSHAETVTVDSNMSNAFMAVFQLDVSGGPNYNAYEFGSPWALSDVKSTVSASNIKLEANYNTYANAATPTDRSYWRSTTGAGPGTGLEGNKWMAASTFAKVSASWFTDGNCNFQAEVTDQSFVTGYEVRAFIKGINPGTDPLQTFTAFSDPLEQGDLVNLNFDTTTWAEIEYGFEVQGINANPAFPTGSATVAAFSNPPLEPVIGIPNAGFEIPDGGKWAFDQANGHTVSYPTEGGNPGGYAEIDATAATNTFFGVLVSNGRLSLPLSALSLTPGQKCTFAMDMKIVSGTNIGGLKVDFVPSGTTGDMYPTRRGTGAEWSTYSFAATIPANATGLKLVPLWRAGSKIAYDNIRLAGPFSASATTAASNFEISWPTVTGRTYQVRKSNNLLTWLNVGTSTAGNGSTITLSDPIVSPGKAFYQVIETKP